MSQPIPTTKPRMLPTMELGVPEELPDLARPIAAQLQAAVEHFEAAYHEARTLADVKGPDLELVRIKARNLSTVLANMHNDMSAHLDRSTTSFRLLASAIRVTNRDRAIRASRRDEQKDAAA
jgi:hypothetical protein